MGEAGSRRAAAPVAMPDRARRILMIAPTSFFADYGCHVRILEEIRVLQRLGHEIKVVTYYNGRDVPGVEIRRTVPIPWRRNYEVGSSRHKIAFDALLALRTLTLLGGWRPDIVHGHLHEGALIGWFASRLLGRPLVFDFQGSLTGEMIDHGFLQRNGWACAVFRRLEHWIDHRPAAIVTSSAQGQRHLATQFGVPPDRVLPLPDCVDATVFRPDVLSAEERQRERAALGIPAGCQVIVYLGLLARHQGTDLLLQAARLVVNARPDVHFLVMGFPGTETYGTIARQLGLAAWTTFTGRVPYEEAPRRLALGDLALATKLSATEGSGKILDYMAMGLPTVAFDTPASREYLGDDGFYAAAGDADDLARAILHALAQPETLAARAARLRARATAEYDWLIAGRKLVEVYDRLIAGCKLVEAHEPLAAPPRRDT